MARCRIGRRRYHAMAGRPGVGRIPCATAPRRDARGCRGQRHHCRHHERQARAGCCDRRHRRRYGIPYRRRVCRGAWRAVCRVPRGRRRCRSRSGTGHARRNAARRYRRPPRGTCLYRCATPDSYPAFCATPSTRKRPFDRCHAVVDSLGLALVIRISDSFCWTCWENTYCAGRWFLNEISCAIGPSVCTPRLKTPSALSGCRTAS